jgi:hypothetical protein
MNTSRSLLAGLLTILPVLTPLRAASPDQNAQFLAGLSVTENAFGTLSKKNAFQEHATAFQSAWNAFDKRQTQPIHAWQKEFLPSAKPTARPLIYLFSGPDILHAHTFFPEASTYVLCGIEPIGTLPEVDKIDPAKISTSLQQIRQSLESVLSWSFFKTKDMKNDLTATPLQGTLPILYVFLARMHCTITSVEWVSVDRAGHLSAGKTPGSLAPGVKIEFTRPGQTTPQTVYYFCSDLSDGTAPKSGLLKWCASLGPCDAFLKSASYLMHSNDFQYVRKHLLEHSERLLQDDSGIPFKHLSETDWNLTPFGIFLEPIPLFKEHQQPDLKALFEKNRPKALPFAFGYNWRPKQSGILLATRKLPATAAKVLPVRRLPKNFTPPARIKPLKSPQSSARKIRSLT